jgi:hypothetical protein
MRTLLAAIAIVTASTAALSQDVNTLVATSGVLTEEDMEKFTKVPSRGWLEMRVA